MRVWRIIWRERFMGTVRAETEEQAKERYAEWSSVPQHELRAERSK